MPLKPLNPLDFDGVDLINAKTQRKLVTSFVSRLSLKEVQWIVKACEFDQFDWKLFWGRPPSDKFLADMLVLCKDRVEAGE